MIVSKIITDEMKDQYENYALKEIDSSLMKAEQSDHETGDFEDMDLEECSRE